jgi:glycosyltransferase involved in cell wall biosynthesis
METFVKWFLKKQRPDLFLSMEGFLSLGSHIPQLPVIYDLNFEHYPKDHTFKNRIYYRTFFTKFAQKAARIATISEYSKQDIVKWYSVSEDKIDNVSCGIKQKFSPLKPDEIIQTRQQYTNGLPYFFFIGSMHPRKNIVRLLRAFSMFKVKTQSNLKLVLSGHILWDDASIHSALEKLNLKEDVIFTGRVTDESLRLLLGAAFALSFVPTFEGFGLPIVEAFEAGVPVICSNTTSMPEVAGDAALLVDPFNEQEIAEAMERMCVDADLRLRLVEKGNVQKQQFTWERTADLLFESVRKVLK